MLTDLVVERNQWAQQLVNRPGVYVASSTDDVLKVVDEVARDVGDLMESVTPVGR